MKIMISGAIVSNSEKWIYDWLEIESVCPRDVNEMLDYANRQKVDVYINSGGGDVFAGSEIYSALRTYQGEVKIHVVGLAASAASVIACAGESDISPTAMLMIHNVSSSANGDYRVMDKESEILQKANEAVSAAYREKCGITQEQALEMMNRESWMTAEEAVKVGLIDEIAGSAQLQLVAAAGDIIPSRLIEKLKSKLKGSTEKPDFSFEQNKLNLLKLKGEIKNEI